MATNKITITFTGAASDGDYIEFATSPSGVPITYRQTFRSVRDAVGETEIATTAEGQALNYYNAMVEDYGSALGLTIDGAVVEVASRSGYSLSGASLSGDFGSYEITSLPVVVYGIGGNRYLINNPIILDIGTGIPTDFYRIVITNTSNGKATSPITVYPDLSGSIQVDIAPYLKSIFDLPEDASSYAIPNQPINTAQQIAVSVFLPGDSDTPSYSVTKTFIRGGRRSNATNLTISANQPLRPSNKLPVWQGYQTADYVLVSGVTTKKLLAAVDPEDIDYRRSKSCNSVYVKFANQSGGYSTWLFESHEWSESSQNKGVFFDEQALEDLGNESSMTLKVYGKIPKEYIGLIRDLIISPDIRVVTGGVEVKVTSGRNNIPFDNVKTAQYVTINLNTHYRFNPSVLWSNS